MHRASRIVSIGLLIAITLLSAARCAAIMTNYGAPMHLYTHLHERLAPRVANTPRIATEQTGTAVRAPLSLRRAPLSLRRAPVPPLRPLRVLCLSH